MKVSEETYNAMPAELQKLFCKLPNAGRAEVLEGFPETVAATSRTRRDFKGWKQVGELRQDNVYQDGGGSAARFFYCAKASRSDRGEDNKHPTVKNTALMRWLCRLITPPGGLILDCFMGSGSTAEAAWDENFRFVGIEQEEEYYQTAIERMKREAARTPLFTEPLRQGRLIP